MLAMKSCLMTRQRRTFSPEFKQQSAFLVLDEGYRLTEPSRSVGVDEAVLRRCVQQLQMGRHPLTIRAVISINALRI
jgi:transposase